MVDRSGLGWFGLVSWLVAWLAGWLVGQVDRLKSNIVGWYRSALVLAGLEHYPLKRIWCVPSWVNRNPFVD